MKGLRVVPRLRDCIEKPGSELRINNFKLRINYLPKCKYLSARLPDLSADRQAGRESKGRIEIRKVLGF